MPFGTVTEQHMIRAMRSQQVVKSCDVSNCACNAFVHLTVCRSKHGATDNTVQNMTFDTLLANNVTHIHTGTYTNTDTQTETEPHT